MKISFLIGLFILTALNASCGSRPVIANKSDVRVSKEAPGGSCTDMGTLIGRTMHAAGTREAALDDLKEQAASKGATDIQVHQFSDMGTSVTGTLFICE